MKFSPAGLFVSLSIAAGFAPSAHSSEPWQSDGPSGTFFHSLAQAPDGTIFAGTVSGLLRYDDSQHRWRPTSSEQSRVGLVFVSSRGVLFAESYSGGCISWYEHLVSLDHGETWSEDPGLPASAGIVAIAETPDGALWAGTFDDQLYRRPSTASGWTRNEPIPGLVGLLDLAVTTDGNLVALGRDAGTGESAVFLSDDNWASWSIRLLTAARLQDLSAGPSGSVVAGGRGQEYDTVTFFLSTNSGRTWFERPCRSEACEGLISVEELSVLHDRTVAAAGHSADRVSSRLIVSDLFLEEWRSVARYSLSPAALLTDRSGALWVVGLPYAWRSRDDAASFGPVADGVVETSVTSLVESGGSLLATVGSYAVGGFAGINPVPGSSGIHVSTDRGETWTPTSVWQANQVVSSLSQGVLAATDLGVLRSVDHGDSWHSIPGTEEMAALAVAESSTGALCVIATSELHCRIDSGADWFDPVPHSNTDALTVTSNDVFLVERLGTVQRSADGGHTWDETPLAENISGFFIDPDGAVHAPIVDSDRIAVSSDSGQTWSFIHAPFPNPSSIAFHPVRGMFVGYPHIIYSSDDGGGLWNRIDLPAVLVSLQVNGDRLIAGSERDGVWLVDLPPSVRTPSGRVGQ